MQLLRRVAAKGCRLRLKWKKFGLSHHRPASFGTAQWQKRETVSVPYLLYRFLLFAFFWGFFVYFLVDTPDDLRPYVMIYLTVWTYITAMLDVALQLAASCVVAFRHHHGIRPVLPPWLYKTHWVIVNISHTMEPFVTVHYWTAVFPQADEDVTYTDIHLHLLTTLYALMDLTIHGSPRRYHHVTFPLCFGLAYLLFTWLYYLCGGLAPDGSTAIYPVLDWSRPGRSLAAVAVAGLAIFVLHAFTWAVVQLRQRLHRRWHGSDEHAEASEQTAAGAGSRRHSDGAGDGAPHCDGHRDGELGASAGGGGGRASDASGVSGEGSGGSEKDKENSEHFYINMDAGGCENGTSATVLCEKQVKTLQGLDNEAAVVDDDLDHSLPGTAHGQCKVQT